MAYANKPTILSKSFFYTTRSTVSNSSFFNYSTPSISEKCVRILI